MTDDKCHRAEGDDRTAQEDVRRVRVFRDRCSTCIFNRAASPVDPERTREVIEANRAVGAALPCHKGVLNPREYEDVLCKGFFDAYRYTTNSLVVYERIGGEYEWVDPI